MARKHIKLKSQKGGEPDDGTVFFWFLGICVLVLVGIVIATIAGGFNKDEEDRIHHQ